MLAAYVTSFAAIVLSFVVHVHATVSATVPISFPCAAYQPSTEHGVTHSHPRFMVVGALSLMFVVSALALRRAEWEDPAAIDAVLRLMPTLPHLKEIVVAFFRGALATWIRFSSEFAPGGLIDEASATERQLAWMPATNDANEGSLGQLRVVMLDHPTLTLHQFNAAVMYNQNDTQDFMDALFEWPDHLYIMRLARKEDASGIERKCKAELAEFRIRLAAMKKAKEVAKHQKEIDDLRILVKVPLVSTVTEIYTTVRDVSLTVKKLHQQLDAFRLRGVPEIKANSTYARKADKQAAVEAALKKYRSSPESYPIPAAVLTKLSVPQIRPETQVVEEWGDEEDVEMEE
ncbi:hypothetical protein C8F04DRAFT_1180214 [Mycena alexandri]|uniref:Uncharacterized protein n=1 Tax=Mycena alexandri TaxID=1745969 RepID=A0AAD6X5U9_9AGAR|nr:hypothetical protein C8F04DRAFT_1180214 [Mycena alexandri]